MEEIFSHKQVYRLEQLLDYKFGNLDLIHEALSHPSLKQQHRKWQKDYERLEILGDAILGFLITELLYKKYSNFDAGNLAKIKAYLVSETTICRVAEQIHLDEFMIMGKGEEDSGGRKNSGNVENTMEAVLAAIYLDSGIESVKKIVLKLWDDYIGNFNFAEIDPKTSLQEWSQENKFGIPHYKILGKTGEAHNPVFTVEVRAGQYHETGQGHSIKQAEKDAARILLTKMLKS